MFKNENIFYLAITLKTKMTHKNYKILINVEVITCNLRHCAGLVINFSKSILKIVYQSLKKNTFRVTNN